MTEQKYDSTAMARDNLALSNERTLLSYLRTSLALVGVTIAIFKYGTLEEGIVLGSMTLATGTVILLYGHRNYRAMNIKIYGHAKNAEEEKPEEKPSLSALAKARG